MRMIVHQFVEDALSAMHVGEGHEDWMNSGSYQPGSRRNLVTSFSQDLNRPGALFNFGDLTELTSTGVQDAALRTQLLGILQRASDAATTGAFTQKEQALADFPALLQKVRGVSIPSVTADYLGQIARSL